jgi:transposase InsO family protein
LARVQRAWVPRRQIAQAYTEERSVYGALKTWIEPQHRDHLCAPCTVERLMRELGLRSVIRSARCEYVALRRPAGNHPAGLVQRAFAAATPCGGWVTDRSYRATRHGGGYVAFVIDLFLLRIVGWRAHTAMRADLGSTRSSRRCTAGSWTAG